MYSGRGFPAVMVFTGAFRSVVKRAEYCFPSRMGKTNPSVFGGWAVPNPGKTGSGLGRGGTGLACSETGGARSGGKAAGTLRWRCPRRRARQGTQCAPGPETNKSFIQQRPSLRNHAVSVLQRSGFRGNICPCKKCSLPDAEKEHMLPLFRIVQAIYSSAISRATKTPLAEAWDREWVTPLPSPITYSPG